MGNKIYITNSFEETRNIGQKLSSEMRNKRIYALYGDLGSGKTTFTQGFARGLGIKNKIISPTFIIVRSYKINYKKYKNFYHIDLYRIEENADVDELGLSDILNNPENIAVIEWPEKAKGLMEDALSLRFEYIKDNSRKIIYLW